MMGFSMTNILVVDDDTLILDVIKDMLESQGYQVTVASDGNEAMKVYDSSTDLVVTDMVMPRKNGIELIKELLERNPRTKIIAISGGGHLCAEDYLKLARLLGAKRTFTKPLAVKPFLSAVTEVLREEVNWH